MRLKTLPVFGQLSADDLAGEQHSACFSSKGSASDHAVPKLEIVFRAEILPNHILQPLISRQRALYDLLFRFPAERSSLIFHLCQSKKTVMAVIILILGLGVFLLHKLIISAHGNASVHSLKRTVFRQSKRTGMGEEHPGGIPVPHLQRMQIHPLSPAIHVHKKLGRIPDPCDCVKGMPAPKEREVRYCIKTEKIGTCHAEKISHHQIRIPD